MSGSFTLTGTIKRHDKVTPLVDATVNIWASPYPDPTDLVLYTQGASAVTDANGVFSRTLLVETGLYYIVASGSVPPLFDAVTFAVPATGTTVDLSALTSFNPGSVTPSVLTQAIAAKDAAAASAAAAAASAASVVGGWQANTVVTAGTIRVAPDGTTIRRNADGTTRATYDATEQALWTPIAAVAGTGLKVALDAAYPARVTPTQHAPAFGLFFPEANGAVANGTTNDSAALNAAMVAAAAAPGGGTVMLAQGKTYGFVAPVTHLAGVTISGRGTLKALAASTGQAIIGTDVSNVAVLDVTIDMNKAATVNGGATTNQQGIYYVTTTAASTGVRIEGVKVLNCWQRGIHVSSLAGGSYSDVSILRSSVTSTGSDGIIIQGNGNADKTSPSVSTRYTIARNIVTSAGTNGIAFIGVSHVTVSENFVNGSGTSTGHGIAAGGSTTGTAGSYVYHQATDFTIKDNKITGFTAGVWGIVVTVLGTRFSIHENIVWNNVGGITIDLEDGVAVGVEIQADGTVANNKIRGSTGSHGINVRLCNSLKLVGNIIRGNAGDGIAISTATRVDVLSNTCTGNTGNGVSVNGTVGGGHRLRGNALTGNTGADLAVNSVLAIPLVLGTDITTYIVKPTLQAVTNSTVLVNDADLQMPVAANATYEIVVYMKFDADTAGDLKVQPSMPTGATIEYTVVGPAASIAAGATGVGAWGEASGSVGTSIGGGGAGLNLSAIMTLWVTTTTAGTFILKWAQGTASLTATNMQAGSRLVATRRA